MEDGIGQRDLQEARGLRLSVISVRPLGADATCSLSYSSPARRSTCLYLNPKTRMYDTVIKQLYH